MIPYLILTGVVCLAVGGTVGHRTARIRIIVIGATAQEDQAALDDDSEQQILEWRTQLEECLDRFDIPDDPRSDAT
ncbi:hypothetical protein ACH5A7_20975 [Streptomyces sp. NPDC018955]|uniref:hypothetical protein n=1 Tax=Streptomyces sp. NPDC018955 TaxID=3365055 RepID=UPI0037959B59